VGCLYTRQGKDGGAHGRELAIGSFSCLALLLFCAAEVV
jgi:hypothetical protein